MDPSSVAIIRLSVLVLLPIIPAFLLFKALPSTAMVSGPFQGLTINLGGSFAGYFVVLLILLSAHSVWSPVPIEVWTIDGSVLDASGKPIPAPRMNVSVLPPPLALDDAGGFSGKVSTGVGPTGYSEYPKIEVSGKDLIPRKIDLKPGKSVNDDDLKIDWDASRQTVQITKIVMQPAPQYNEATALPLQPAPPGHP
jgi:hypothetical protein